MTKAHKHADVIHAWADGAKVQYKSQRGEQEWKDDPFPCFDVSYEYRIKPEPKPDISFYARLELDNLPKRVQVMDPDPQLHNVKLTFCGETNKLKSVEVL